jgi:hypothetical protein
VVTGDDDEDDADEQKEKGSDFVSLSLINDAKTSQSRNSDIRNVSANGSRHSFPIVRIVVPRQHPDTSSARADYCFKCRLMSWTIAQHFTAQSGFSHGIPNVAIVFIIFAEVIW